MFKISVIVNFEGNVY